MNEDLADVLKRLDLDLSTEQIADITGTSYERARRKLIAVEESGLVLRLPAGPDGTHLWRRISDEPGVRGFLAEQEKPITTWQLSKAFGWGQDLARSVLEYLNDFGKAIQVDEDLWVGA